ncbi:MAG: hypothetical protein R2685_10790 [Candidatus Nitrosocosmicus sp.]|nr:hypothetical protein [Candidatus Nitrosocosmicus sp.]
MIKYQKTNKFKGKLIVFEGLSGSGKTECSELLAQELRDRDYKVHVYHLNPFDNSMLVKMYDILQELKPISGANYPSYQRKQIPSDPVVNHSLFMLSIFNIRKDILYKLSVCDYVIIDSWVYKNIAYSLLNKVPKNYIMNMTRNILPKPYLVIFLDLHETDSLKKTKDMYEDLFTLRELRANYFNLRKYARERWITVNLKGNETTKEIVYTMILPQIARNI